MKMQRPGQPPQRPNLSGAPGLPNAGFRGSQFPPYMNAPRQVMPGFPGSSAPSAAGRGGNPPGMPPQPSPGFMSAAGSRAGGLFPFGAGTNTPGQSNPPSATPGGAFPPNLGGGGGGGAGGSSGGGGVSQGSAQLNLVDLDDFPALGSGPMNAVGSAPTPAGSSNGPSGGGGGASYASQAGTGASSGPNAPAPAPGLGQATGPTTSQGGGGGGGGATTPGAGRAHAAALSQKPFSQDDFPALGGSMGSHQTTSNDHSYPLPMNGIGRSQPNHHGGQEQMSASLNLSSSQDVIAPFPQTPAQQVLASPADRFGLQGLLSVIKMTDPDLSMLAMGSDLQTLGLNLNAPEALYASFITPWADNNTLASRQIEPDYVLPACYNVQPPPPAQSKIASFSDETLFFIFYSTPRDMLQEVAAQELYNRNWRYHKEMRVWLTKEQGTEPTQKTPTFERGTYVFFDPTLWEKTSKNLVLIYELLEEKVPLSTQAAAAAAAAQAAQQSGAAPAAQAQAQAQAAQIAAAANAVQQAQMQAVQSQQRQHQQQQQTRHQVGGAQTMTV